MNLQTIGSFVIKSFKPAFLPPLLVFDRLAFALVVRLSDEKVRFLAESKKGDFNGSGHVSVKYVKNETLVGNVAPAAK